MIDYTWVDFIILGIFLFNIVLGFARGLTREIVSILSLLVALALTIKFTLPITQFLNNSDGFDAVVSAFATFTSIKASTPLSLLSVGVSSMVLFVGTYSVGEAINYYASTFGVIMFPAFALLDRGLAAIVGFMRGFIFSIVFILIAGLTPASQTDGWTHSYFIAELKPSTDKLGNMIEPGGFPVWTGSYNN